VVTSNGIARFALQAAGDGRAGKLKTGAYGVVVAGPYGVSVESWDMRP
jgi:hypothetical protein